MGPCTCGHSPEEHDPACHGNDDGVPCDCIHYEEDDEMDEFDVAD